MNDAVWIGFLILAAGIVSQDPILCAIGFAAIFYGDLVGPRPSGPTGGR